MFESKLNKGKANGYVPLEHGSKILIKYLPTDELATTGDNTFVGNQTINGLIRFSDYDKIDGNRKAGIKITSLGHGKSTTINWKASDSTIPIYGFSQLSTNTNGVVITNSTSSIFYDWKFDMHGNIILPNGGDVVRNGIGVFSTYATTGSNHFNGNQIIYGTLISNVIGNPQLVSHTTTIASGCNSMLIGPIDIPDYLSFDLVIEDTALLIIL